MPRITLPSPESMAPDQRRVYDRIVSGPRGRIQGPLRAALHNAELADRWQALGELLRYNTTLTPRQSELAILVTGRACNSPARYPRKQCNDRAMGLPCSPVRSLRPVSARARPQLHAARGRGLAVP